MELDLTAGKSCLGLLPADHETAVDGQLRNSERAVEIEVVVTPAWRTKFSSMPVG